MNGISPENLILLGEVTRPHGLTGILRIRSYAESEASFRDAEKIFIESPSGELRSYEVVDIQPHKNIFLLKLAGLNSLEQAEEFRGAGIYVEKNTSTSDEDDAYYWYELIGLGVYLDSGRYVGIVEQVFPTAGNDIYVVREGEKEFLIPAVHDVVKEIDLAGGRMVIFEMEGLLDLNEV